MRRFFFILIPLVLFFSCKPKADFTYEIRLTDSLKSELEKTAAAFYKLDSQKLSEANGIVGAYLDFVTENLRDTINREDATMLSDFKTISKDISRYTKTKREMNLFYEFNLKQITNLEYDLQKGLIDNKDSATKFISAEKEANANLIGMMKLHIQIMPSQLAKFDAMRPRVEAFIKKINSGILPPELVKAAKEKENESAEVD